MSIDLEQTEIHRSSNDPFTMKSTDDNKKETSFNMEIQKGQSINICVLQAWHDKQTIYIVRPDLPS